MMRAVGGGWRGGGEGNEKKVGRGLQGHLNIPGESAMFGIHISS